MARPRGRSSCSGSRSARLFVDLEGAARSAPAQSREPGLGWLDGARFAGHRHGAPPSIEPRPRAPRVDPRRRAQMLSEVQQDVDEAAARLGGRAERVRMIATPPYRALPPQRSVDGLRAAHGQPLQPTNERDRFVSLDDEMDMVALHREVDDAKRGLLRGRERPPQEREDARRTERGKCLSRPQGDVNGPSRLMPRPRSVRRAGPCRDERPASAPAPPSPSPDRRQLQLPLPATSSSLSSRPSLRNVAGRLNHCSIKIEREQPDLLGMTRPQRWIPPLAPVELDGAVIRRPRLASSRRGRPARQGPPAACLRAARPPSSIGPFRCSSPRGAAAQLD